MNASSFPEPTSVSTNIVRPAAWTMASANAGRLNDLGLRIMEAQARSTALTAEVIALVAAGGDSGAHERQLWSTLDALECLRITQWVLSQEGPR